MTTLYKKAELLANIAIIVVAIVVCVVLVKRFVINSEETNNANEFKEISAGEKISLPDLDWTKSDKTLLVVIEKGCHFCSDSAAFYQRIAQETASRKNVKLVAVFPHGVDEGREYLKSLGVPITELRQAPLNALKVKGTPTLILVNNAGMVTDTWLGQLSPDKESEVFSRL
jgi:thiol-disulfide isomerase/thioredoxin